MDYSQIRGASANNDETVAVNHRALITRTLTKYPVDYALFRELLQNSADAQASSVEIQFYSQDGQYKMSSECDVTTVHVAPIIKLAVRNNGAPFGEDDWNRLKEIAKGNPNETKIGAFGVGFYSVFELTDEPLVHSGETIMNFYYKGDQLHYRRTKVKKENEWTIIDLPYRSAGRLPNLITFTAFLTQSFTLIPLQNIKLKLDDLLLMELNKNSLDSEQVPLPKTMTYTSPNRSLCLESLEVERFRISVDYLNVTQTEDNSEWNKSIFGFGKKILSLVTSSKNPSDKSSTVCFLRKLNGCIKVRVSAAFAAKMKATVLKAPAKYAHISMLAANLDDVTSSEIQPALSRLVYPESFSDAKIFIGFPTKQTPGMKCHANMNQLIPTMERTAVDLSNAHVKDWNAQMLYMCGVISRALYEIEMSQISTNIKEAACYIMDKAQIDDSAPDKVVGQWIRSGFWQSDSRRIKVPTEDGKVIESPSVRISDLKFLTSTPILAKLAEDRAPSFIESLIRLGYIKKVSIEDVVCDLQNHTIDKDQFKELARWICDNNLDGGSLRSILDAAILSEQVQDEGEVVTHLSSITRYQERHTFEGLPLPPDCIPYRAISAIDERWLIRLGWRELTLMDWLRYIIEQRSSLPDRQNFTKTPEFAIRVLEVIAQAWPRLAGDFKLKVRELLSSLPCIPTQKGLQKPSDAYLSEIPLFPNLPVKVSQLAVSHDFLVSIGLRVAVEVSYVLDKLEKGGEQQQSWTVEHVVQYLAKHSRALRKDDWDALRKTAFLQSTTGEPSCPADLYAPDHHLKKLDVKVLRYEAWSASSSEAHLLYKLGLQRFPSLTALFNPTVLDSPMSCKVALQYYVQNYEANKYSADAFTKLNPKVILCMDTQLRGPQQCYTSETMKLFGLAVAEHSMVKHAWKLGIKEAPSVGVLVERLLSLPHSDVAIAESQFAYLSSRANELTKSSIDACSTAKLVPVVRRRGSRKVFWQIPSHAFFLDDGGPSDDEKFFFTFFDCVDLSTNTVPFLIKIGVRYRPSVSEVINLALADPQRVYDLAGGPSRYELFLRYIADNWDQNRHQNSQLKMKMQASPFLLGFEHSVDAIQPKDDEEDAVIHHKSRRKPMLLRASEIVIVDDIISFNQFKSFLRVAPDATVLEDFYKFLGTKELSEVVERHVELGPIVNDDTEQSMQIRDRVVERTKLFLESTREKARIESRSLNDLKVQAVKYIRLHSRVNNGPVCSPYFVESLSGWTDDGLLLKITLRGFDWLDVSRTMVKTILKRPNPDSVIILDLQLRSSLKELEHKGYNVDRLLKKEYEKRQEEEKERILQQERMEADRLAKDRALAEENKLQDAKRLMESSKASTERTTGASLPSTASQPGKQSPVPSNQGVQKPLPPPAAIQPKPEPHKSLFSHWKQKMTGVNSQLASPQTQSQSQIEVDRSPTRSGGSAGAASQDVLRQGISQTAAFNKSSLRSNIHTDVPPPQSFECKPSQAEHLRYCATASHLRCFVGNSMPDLSAAELEECRRFEDILIACSNVFQLKPKCMHIFYDPSSKSIAFNANGSLFFNLHFFLYSLNTGTMRPLKGPWDPTESLDYWFPVMAHELAHNLVADHGASHSFYCESYIQAFMERFKAISSQWTH